MFIATLIEYNPAVALSQSQENLLLECCCMGVVNQIKYLDNSSSVTLTATALPLYGCCVPNQRFGQHLTFTKGSLFANIYLQTRRQML